MAAQSSSAICFELPSAPAGDRLATRRSTMNTLLLVSVIVLSMLLLVLGFLVLGTLRALGILTWRLEQLEATTPRRIGRDGIKLGKKAPEFSLPSVSGGDKSLAD